MLTDNMRGGLTMSASMALFTLSDTFMKTLSGQVPLHQIVLIRNGITTAAMLLLAWRAGVLFRGMARRDFKLALVRALSEVGAAYFFLTALFNMPLANVTAVLQSAPLVVTLAAAVFLGEKVGWRRIGAIVAGFIGVLLIIRPGPEGFNIFAGYTLVSVLFITLRDLVTRRLSKEAPTLLVTAMTSGIVGIGFGVTGIGQEWVRLDWSTASLICGAGIMVLGAYLASVQAMRLGEIGFVSPFRYTSLLWALALGWIVFGNWPTPLTLLGAAIVVMSGTYTFYREMVLHRQTGRPPVRRAGH